MNLRTTRTDRKSGGVQIMERQSMQRGHSTHLNYQDKAVLLPGKHVVWPLQSLRNHSDFPVIFWVMGKAFLHLLMFRL